MNGEASTVFRATYSRNAAVWGVTLAVLLEIPFVVILFLSRQGPSVFLIFLGALFTIVPGLIIYFALAGRTLSYAVTKDEFTVNFGLSKFRTPYIFIESVELVVDLTLWLRLFGGSWPGLHWGLFKSNKGNVNVYATREKGNFIVISLVDGKKIAITPAEPEAFLQKINAERSRFGTATAKDIEMFVSRSKRLIYAQVAVVATAFFLFSTYFLWIYPSLPEIVPVHSNLNGTPDRWGHKSELILLVGIAAVFTALHAVLALKFGKYAKGMVAFLTVVFVLLIAMFFSVLYTTHV